MTVMSADRYLPWSQWQFQTDNITEEAGNGRMVRGDVISVGSQWRKCTIGFETGLSAQSSWIKAKPQIRAEEGSQAWRGRAGRL